MYDITMLNKDIHWINAYGSIIEWDPCRIQITPHHNSLN